MAKQGVGSASPEAPVGGNDSKPVHVMELVKQHDFLSIGLGGKIHCALTKRDLPLSTVAVQQHLNSKKLKKEREWYNADFTKYEPLIVAHKTNPKLLFCTLTRIELNRIPKEVEAHVNGKRFRNRKAEMEGLKQAQRQPMVQESDEEEEEEEEEEEDDDAEFWAPPGGAKLEDMDEDGESDLEGGEEEEEEEEEGAGEAGVGGAGRRAPRGSKTNGGKAGNRKKGGGGKGDEARKATKGGQEKGGNKKGGAKKKQQEGKGAPRKSAAKGGKSSPLSEGTPAVSNAVVLKDGGAPASLPSPSAKKAKNKAKSPNKSKGKGGGTPEGKKSVVAAASVGATSAVKRKHKISEEPTSGGKKKRKG